MGFDSRHRDDATSREQPLAESLAKAHRLELERAREVLERANAAAAADPHARSVRQWFEILVEQDARSRRGWRADGVPGRRTQVERGERAAESAAEEPRRAEVARAPQRLDVATQWRMSQAFGFDFSGVSIRRDSPAATGRTRALVKDGEIHFREGSYEPGTRAGDWLIAHELAHIVQQQGGRGERAPSTKAIEREADRAATLAMLGRTAPIALRAQASVAYAFSDGDDHDELGGGDDAYDPKSDLAMAPVPGEGGGGGGAPGGGGGAVPKPQKEAPNVAAAPPEAGFAQLQGVRPDKLVPALGQVHTAATAEVGKKRARAMANQPKQMSNGDGAAAKGKGADADAGAAGGGGKKAVPGAAEKVEKQVKGEVPGGEAAKQQQQGAAQQQQQNAGAPIAATAQQNESWLASFNGKPAGGASANGDGANGGTANGGQPTMSDAEMKQMSSSLSALPTSASDISTDPGPAPELAMKGEAKATADQDRAKLEQQTSQAQAQGQADSRVPLGEDSIETTVPTEELTAKSVAAGAAPEVALPTVAGAAPSEEVAIVAQEQSGAQIDAALAQASGDVAAERARHAQEDQKARADADQQIRELKTKADADQAIARAHAKSESDKARAEWQSEIDKKGADARKQADKKVAEGMAQVEAEEQKANAEAKQHIEGGKQKADDEKRKGEDEARKAKQKGEEKSSGFFGWLSSKAKAFFDGIKQAISAAIDACKKAVKAVIDAAKKLAMAAIELARKAIVAAIKAIGEALIAITDVLLAAFPELKARFQGLIRKAVDKAVETVNKLAEGLKRAVQAALDALGKALDAVLGLLEKGLHAIVDMVADVVQGYIDAAKAIVDALGEWVKIIKDVAKGPGAWVGKLGAAVVDGIKNHLWSAFKTAVVEWFKSKVIEVLGIAGMILQILMEGGITMDDIVKMALDALIVAIPAALVAILIEKLVAMIVPAAGALMAIIEGLQAAWGTISRIIAAFSAFMAFLSAVQGGGAGPLFATALASAAVVVLDFVANWLLRKLRGPAGKVGKKLEGIAEKLKLKKKSKGKGKPGSAKEKPKQKGSDADGPGAGAPKGKPKKPHDDADGPNGVKGKPKKPHDDADGPNGNSKKQDKDAKKQKDAERAANAAARAGWRKASSLTTRKVRQVGEVLRALDGMKRQGKARTEVAVDQMGTSWRVRAHATLGSARATAHDGNGGVLRDPSSRPWLLSTSLGGKSRQLIDEASRKLMAPGDKDKAGNIKAQYQAKQRLARTLEREATSELDQVARGVRMQIELEPEAGAEADLKIRTKITVAPNTETHYLDIPVLDADFDALQQRLTRELGEPFELPDLAILNARNAAKEVGFDKCEVVKRPSATGEYSYDLIFHHPTKAGKTQAWGITKDPAKSNDHCPACSRPITDVKVNHHATEDPRDASRPHFFLPQSALEKALELAAATVAPNYTGADHAAFAAFQAALPGKGKQLVGSKTNAANSGRDRSTNTEADQQMQCRKCEDTGPQAHRAYTLTQRVSRLAADPTLTPAHVGHQAGGASLTEAQADELSAQRITLFIAPELRSKLARPTNWPTGLTHLAGNRQAQIAELVEAFIAHAMTLRR